MKIKLPKLKCKRCDHEWVPRRKEVRQCPSCKSAYWDKQREKDYKLIQEIRVEK